ncbi:Proline-, glutamic acid- and leucine-rich protein 1 [Balamuthia mandrillaris]
MEKETFEKLPRSATLFLLPPLRSFVQGTGMKVLQLFAVVLVGAVLLMGVTPNHAQAQLAVEEEVQQLPPEQLSPPSPSSPKIMPPVPFSPDYLPWTLYAACHEDRLRFCPELEPPYTPELLFGESACFEGAWDQLSDSCLEAFSSFLDQFLLDGADLEEEDFEEEEEDFDFDFDFDEDEEEDEDEDEDIDFDEGEEFDFDEEDEDEDEDEDIDIDFDEDEDEEDEDEDEDEDEEVSAADLYEACMRDREEICPEVSHSVISLFRSPCFAFNQDAFSPQCLRLHKLFQMTYTDIEDGPTPGPVPVDGADRPWPADDDDHGRPHHGHHDDPLKEHVSLYAACHKDRVTFCPALQPPYTKASLFHSSCFLHNYHNLSPACQAMMREELESSNLRHQLHAFLSVLWLTMFTLSVALLGVSCCCLCVRCCRSGCSSSRSSSYPGYSPSSSSSNKKMKRQKKKKGTAEEKEKLMEEGDQPWSNQAEEAHSLLQPPFYFPMMSPANTGNEAGAVNNGAYYIVYPQYPEYAPMMMMPPSPSASSPAANNLQ